MSVAGFTESFTVKPLAWRYEAETRLITRANHLKHESGRHFHTFEPAVFRGVVLGLHCDIAVPLLREHFHGCQLGKAKIWRITNAPGNFKLARNLPENTRLAMPGVA